MINNIVLMGKVVELPNLRETVSGNKYVNLLLEIRRPYPNIHGEFDSDRISVTLWQDLAETANKECKIGDIVGVKGHIQSYSIKKETQVFYNYEMVAEQVSFLNVEK